MIAGLLVVDWRLLERRRCGAYLLELSGETAASRAAYRVAAGKTMRLPRRRYLDARVALLAGDQPGEGSRPREANPIPATSENGPCLRERGLAGWPGPDPPPVPCAGPR